MFFVTRRVNVLAKKTKRFPNNQVTVCHKIHNKKSKLQTTIKQVGKEITLHCSTEDVDIWNTSQSDNPKHFTYLSYIIRMSKYVLIIHHQMIFT